MARHLPSADGKRSSQAVGDAVVNADACESSVGTEVVADPILCETLKGPTTLVPAAADSGDTLDKRVVLCMNVELSAVEIAEIESTGGKVLVVTEFGSSETSAAQAKEVVDMNREGRVVWLWGVIRPSQRANLILRALPRDYPLEKQHLSHTKNNL